jgi:hypothetical protein
MEALDECLHCPDQAPVRVGGVGRERIVVERHLRPIDAEADSRFDMKVTRLKHSAGAEKKRPWLGPEYVEVDLAPPPRPGKAIASQEARFVVIAPKRRRVCHLLVLVRCWWFRMK